MQNQSTKPTTEPVRSLPIDARHRTPPVAKPFLNDPRPIRIDVNGVAWDLFIATGEYVQVTEECR